MAKIADPDQAGAHAQELCAPLGRRWLHVQAVATQAAELARSLDDPFDRQALQCAAWLHDIGYSPEISSLGFHPIDGARHLESIGWHHRVVNLVANHSHASYEAEERGLSDALREYPAEVGLVSDALVCSDMWSGPSGEVVSVDERIAGIFERYNETSPVYRALIRSQADLQESVKRAAEALKN